MSRKASDTPFDFLNMMPKWPSDAFSNWALAEREDKLEDKAVAGIQKFNKSIWEHAEKAFDEHMAFISHRLHEDFECAKSLSQCRMPDETMSTLQSFYTSMANEYRQHFEKQAEMFRDSFTDNVAAAEELNETALQSVSEFGKAAEEMLAEAQETAQPAKRKRTTAAKS